MTITVKVRDQIVRDRAQLDRDLARVTDERARAFADYDEHFETVNRLSAEVIAADDVGAPVTEQQQQALNAAHADAMRAMTRALGLGARVRRVQQALERVGSDADVSERLNTAERLAALPARRKGPGEKGPSMRSAAISVLLDQGPQHFREITRIAQESGLFRTKGKTPAQTMSAMLAVDAKASDPMFKRVAAGIYDVADPAKARAEIGAPDPEPPALKSPLDFDCPTCGSPAGENCTKPRGGGRTGRQHMSKFHAPRRDAVLVTS
jgi:hypothetical protein